MARKSNSPISADEALAAIVGHGGARKASAALGIPRTTLRRIASKAEAPAQGEPEAGSPASTAQGIALTPEMLSVLRAAAAALASPAVQAVLAQQTPPAVPAPLTERPRIRVPARTAAASGPRVAPEADPLGDNTPYAGEIFGVHTRRSPRIGAPVSRQHIRVLAIGDSHFHPGLHQTMRCMALVGQHAAQTRPEHIVHIGDGSDWHSVCRHTKNDTWGARLKPSIRQDLDCFRENWLALNSPIDAAGFSASRHYCMGNHDKWVDTFEDSTPEIRGMATGERDRILADAGWTFSDYGEFYFLGGVGFTHVPLNLMGKPMGGQTPENSVATQATHDVVFGHTHRYNSCRRVKVGYANQVSVLNTGGSMPEFYVGDYAQNTQGSAMTSGVLDIDIFDGRIQGHRLVTMRELEKRYGHLIA